MLVMRSVSLSVSLSLCPSVYLKTRSCADWRCCCCGRCCGRCRVCCCGYADHFCSCCCSARNARTDRCLFRSSRRYPRAAREYGTRTGPLAQKGLRARALTARRTPLRDRRRYLTGQIRLSCRHGAPGRMRIWFTKRARYRSTRTTPARGRVPSSSSRSGPGMVESACATSASGVTSVGASAGA
jgi:hypothetical protein